MLKPLSVLIVEDSESDAQLAVRLFGKAGYQVTSLRVETRGAMAAALAHGAWDSVIADHSMPEFDAFAALETLQSTGLDIPFIVVSGHIGEETAVALMKAGAADYVKKDNLGRLTAAVERELREAATRREHRQAIEALRVSEERYRTSFDSFSEPTTHWSRDGILLMQNIKSAENLGGRREDFIGKSIHDLFGQAANGYLERIVRVVDSGLPDTQEDVVDLAKGRCWFWTSMQRMTEPDGQSVAQIISYDITERKRTEETLRQSEEKLRLVADFTHDWEYWVRPDGVMSYVSPACERITGYTADEFMQEPGLLGRIVFPADADIFAGHMRDTLERRTKQTELVYRIVTRSGEVRCIGHSCQPVYGTDGAWLGERANNRDVTQRTEDLRKLRQRTAQLEALRQISLSLTAQLDLNTLLHSIISQAAALLEAKSGVLFLHRPDLDALEWVVGAGLKPSLTGSLLRRGEGLSGRVWQTGEPMMVADYQAWDGRAARYEGEAMGALVGVPVRWGDDFLGVIEVVNDSPRAFSAGDVELLTLFASVAAIALRNARAMAQEAAHLRVSEALGRATRAVANALGLDALLESLVGAALEATPAADGGGVLLMDGETRELVVQASVGFAEESLLQLRFDPGEAAPLWKAFEGEALMLPDIGVGARPEKRLAAIARVRSAIVAPLRYRGKGIGVLVLTCSKSTNAFTSADLSLLMAIADQCAVAVENARLAADGQMRAILEERQRLARDLHDSVTQSLYGLTLFTQASREWAAAGDLERVESQLARIAETAQQALKEMRLLVYELRPFNLQSEGIVSALNRRLDSVERRAGVDARLLAEVEGDLPPIVEETLYRIAQEALANALKHAHASRVSVHLHTRDGWAKLEVVDDGMG